MRIRQTSQCEGTGETSFDTPTESREMTSLSREDSVCGPHLGRFSTSTTDSDDLETGGVSQNEISQNSQQEEDHISILLKDDFKRAYLKISGEVLQGLIDGLRGTLRWQDLSCRVDPSFRENNLGHVSELLVWCNAIQQDYPELYNEIRDEDPERWNDLLSMIIVHDIGEIGLGDVPLVNQNTEEGRRKKLLEPEWAKFLILHSLTEDDASRLISLYERYEEADDNDKIALFAKAMDKGQATANVAKHIVTFNQGEIDNTAPDFLIGQAHTIDYLLKLLHMFRSPVAKEQLLQFFQENVIVFFEDRKLPHFPLHQLKATLPHNFEAKIS